MMTLTYSSNQITNYELQTTNLRSGSFFWFPLKCNSTVNDIKLQYFAQGYIMQCQRKCVVQNDRAIFKFALPCLITSFLVTKILTTGVDNNEFSEFISIQKAYAKKII